ncbi:baseplate J/gp47 family protein [Paenibacillus shunpengii]|uniref:Baseplate J/gp47 family protein n=1 Tax=Paenibacillus shunpengii TaxID=2054424 RepID=A0ABW5SVM0_9BACL
MYEDQTFDAIMGRMLSHFDDTIDKRPTSFIYNQLAPTAQELADAYVALSINADLVLPDNAENIYLERAVAGQGIYRVTAVAAQRAGLFYDVDNNPLDVPLGSRFSIDNMFFTVLSRTTAGRFVMVAETAGKAGNSPIGSMTPVEYIEGLARSELAEVLVEGFDGESDQSLFERFELKLKNPPSTGNRGYYLQLVRAVPGVRNARIYRGWNGPGTARIVLISPEMRTPSAAVIAEVQRNVDLHTPIGDPLITVSGAEEVMISVSANLYIRDYDISLNDSLTQQVKAQISAYFTSLAAEFINPDLKKNEGGIVRYAKIGESILNADAVIDYDNLKVAGGAANVQLQPGQIPIIGALNLTFEGVAN